MTLRRYLALLAALVAISGIALQFAAWRSHRDADVSSLWIVWRLLGFFTILSNIGAAATGFAQVFKPKSLLAGPQARLAFTVAVVVAGIVNAVALRGTWRPSPLGMIADHMIHDIAPALFLAAWLSARDGALKWSDALFAALPPAVYFLYALARGAVEHWYAYWFLDPDHMTLPQFLLSAVILLSAFTGVGMLMIAADRFLERRRVRALENVS